VGDSVQGTADEDFIGKDVSIVSGFDSTSQARGRVNYRGADWDARGQAEIAAGTFAKIVGRDGNTLIIEQETN
jgi:membrane protein implicated in regulation of membrane protease activity